MKTTTYKNYEVPMLQDMRKYIGGKSKRYGNYYFKQDANQVLTFIKTIIDIFEAHKNINAEIKTDDFGFETLHLFNNNCNYRLLIGSVLRCFANEENIYKAYFYELLNNLKKASA